MHFILDVNSFEETHTACVFFQDKTTSPSPRMVSWDNIDWSAVEVKSFTVALTPSMARETINVFICKSIAETHALPLYVSPGKNLA